MEEEANPRGSYPNGATNRQIYLLLAWFLRPALNSFPSKRVQLDFNCIGNRAVENVRYELSLQIVVIGSATPLPPIPAIIDKRYWICFYTSYLGMFLLRKCKVVRTGFAMVLGSMSSSIL